MGCLAFLENYITMVSFATVAVVVSLSGIIVAAVGSGSPNIAASCIMFLIGLALVVSIMTGIISIKYGCADPIRKSVSVHGGSKIRNI